MRRRADPAGPSLSRALSGSIPLKRHQGAQTVRIASAGDQLFSEELVLALGSRVHLLEMAFDQIGLMQMVHSGVRDRLRRPGSVAVEFALVGPLLILMLMGMALYGGWFWLAQGVQSLATEGARAAVAGLDPLEREALAHAFVETEARSVYGFAAEDLTVAVEADAAEIRVRVTLDAASHPVMTLGALIPAPPDRIERAAVVRMGGF